MTRFLLLISFVVLCQVLFAIEKPAQWLIGKEKGDTLVQLVMKEGGVVDACTGKAVTKASGITSFLDPEMGEVMLFDDTGQGSILFGYAGSNEVLKGKGVTIETWVKSDEIITGNMYMIWGFGAASFRKKSAGIDSLDLPRRKIFVEPEKKGKRLDYYPCSPGFVGHVPFRVGQWNHVIFVYDERLKMCRSWVNGKLDREMEVFRDPAYVTINKHHNYRAFYGQKNIKVAGFRIRSGVHSPKPIPAMKHYLNQLPWQNKMVLTLDKIDYNLPLPIKITATLEGTDIRQTKKLANYQETVHLEFILPQLPPTNHLVVIQAKAGDRVVYKANAVYSNYPVPKKGKIKINDDKSLSYNGKKIFPVMIYGVFAEQIKEVSDSGFTTAGARDLDCIWHSTPSRDIPMMMKWVDVAIKNNLYLLFGVNAEDKNVAEYVTKYKALPKMLFWYGADEPWRHWDKLVATYNRTRELDGEFPIMNVQCNSMYMKNTAVACDIMGCDPYPIPLVSLRGVAGLTKAASNGSFGLKPVWTVLPCYEDKVPTPEELNCMGAIAVISGANGLGIYLWDGRSKKNRNGYYAANHPQIADMLKRFMADILSIENILVEPNLAFAVSDAKQNPAIHAALKKVNGKTYLFLANDQRCPEKAALALPMKSFSKAVPLKAFGYKDTLGFKDGMCEVMLPALAAGVFELK